MCYGKNGFVSIFQMIFSSHIYGLTSFLNVFKRNDQRSLNLDTRNGELAEVDVGLCASPVVSVVVPGSGRPCTFFLSWSVPNFEKKISAT